LKLFLKVIWFFNEKWIFNFCFTILVT
jgi:hypothetical protein